MTKRLRIVFGSLAVGVASVLVTANQANAFELLDQLLDATGFNNGGGYFGGYGGKSCGSKGCGHAQRDCGCKGGHVQGTCGKGGHAQRACVKGGHAQSGGKSGKSKSRWSMPKISFHSMFGSKSKGKGKGCDVVKDGGYDTYHDKSVIDGKVIVPPAPPVRVIPGTIPVPPDPDPSI